MNHLTPESEQREYIDRCKKAYLEMVDEIKRQSPAPMPYYPRD